MSQRRRKSTPPASTWGERVRITENGNRLVNQIIACLVIGIVMLIIFSFIVGWWIGQWKP